LTPAQEKKSGCPRCGKDAFNTFRVKDAGVYMEVCKCKICGFLFVSDEDLLNVAQAKVKELFIKDLRRLGKTGTYGANKKEGN
jgi:hypothetical protein